MLCTVQVLLNKEAKKKIPYHSVVVSMSDHTARQHFNFLKSPKPKLTVACPSFCLSETPLSNHGSVCGRFASGAGEKQGLLAFQEYRLSF